MCKVPLTHPSEINTTLQKRKKPRGKCGTFTFYIKLFFIFCPVGVSKDSKIAQILSIVLIFFFFGSQK